MSDILTNKINQAVQYVFLTIDCVQMIKNVI